MNQFPGDVQAQAKALRVGALVPADLLEPIEDHLQICRGDARPTIRHADYDLGGVGIMAAPDSHSPFFLRDLECIDDEIDENSADLFRIAVHLRQAFVNLDVQGYLDRRRSEEHTSELQSRFGISYAVF